MDRDIQLLKRYGFSPEGKDREDIRKLLIEEINNEDNLEDHECLRVLCFLLFLIGNKEDSKLIWKAKMLNMDAGCMVEGELLFGAGYNTTLEYVIKNSDSEKMINYIKNYDEDDIDRNDIILNYKYYYNIGK